MTALIVKVHCELSHRLAHRQSHRRAAAWAASTFARSAAATPAARTRCARRASCSRCWVMIIDIGKGIIATRVIAPASLQAFGIPDAPATSINGCPVACGFAAIHRAHLSGLVRLSRRQGRGHAGRRRVRAGSDAAARRAHRVARLRDAVRIREPRLDGGGRFCRHFCRRQAACSHSCRSWCSELPSRRSSCLRTARTSRVCGRARSPRARRLWLLGRGRQG